MMITKLKYEIGDRFTVMETVQCRILQIVEFKFEKAYVFELFDNPIFTSVITERELDKLLTEQATL